MAGKVQSVSPQDVMSKLAAFFAGKSDVLLVFVFGSMASGKTTVMSDIDVAVLFTNAPDVYGINDLRDELTERLKKEVDIAVLNEASPILKMQVLKNGMLTFRRDAAAYNRFFVDTLNQYDDLKQTRKSSEENILKGRIYAR